MIFFWSVSLSNLVAVVLSLFWKRFLYLDFLLPTAFLIWTSYKPDTEGWREKIPLAAIANPKYFT